MNKPLQYAMLLLARREYSAAELARKLEKRGFEPPIILQVLAECQRLGLQSDERFIENFCRAHIQQGWGPLKISYALRQKGIAQAVIDQYLAREDDHWLSYAVAICQKKYGLQTFNLLLMRKLQQFLYSRGFPPELIRAVVKIIYKQELQEV